MAFSRTVLAAFAGALVFAAAAFAEEPVLPLKDWEVGPIHAQSSNGIGYCSMKNFYEHGQALVFARDAEGSSSLAVSFPGKLLVSGGQYTAELGIGATKRHVVGLAGTPSVLIIQLGFDRDVYRALQKEKTFSVAFKGKTLIFSLDGTQEALEKLMECANTIAKGGEFAPVTVAAVQDVLVGPGIVSADPAPEQPSLGQEAARDVLQGEIERLRRENRRLLRENQEAMAKLVQLGEPDAVPGIDFEEETARAARNAEQAAQERARKLKEANAALRHRQAAEEVKAVPEEEILLPDVEPAAGQAAADAPASAPVSRTETATVKVRAIEAAKPVIAVRKQGFLETLLKQTGISAKREGDTWSWTDRELYGAAEERPLAGGLAESAGVYVEEAKTRCPGDFAHNFGAVKSLDGLEIMEGELACLDGENDAAAALLFVSKGGKFAVITHEGSTSQMAEALARRDAAASGIWK